MKGCLIMRLVFVIDIITKSQKITSKESHRVPFMAIDGFSI